MKVTDIINSVPHHDQSIESKTKGKARVLLRVYAPVLKNIGMNHSTWKEFDPANLFAD